MGRAGLEGDIDRRTVRRAFERTERLDLGMRKSRATMPAFGQDATVPNDDRADGGVRMSLSGSLPGFLQGEGHELFVFGGWQLAAHKSTFPENPARVQHSFRFKEQLFHELAELTQSGIPFAKALAMMARNPSSALGRWAAGTLQDWETHRSIQTVLKNAGLAERDVAVVEAGEASGRLPEVFRELSAFYHELAKARQALISRSYYPLFIFHFGILLTSIPAAILEGGLKGYLLTVLPAFAVLYAALGLLWLALMLLKKHLASAPSGARFFARLPILGAFFRDWTGWNFAMIASLYLRAGGGLLNAFAAAGRGSGNAALAAGAEAAVRNVRQEGCGLAEAFLRERVLPDELQRALETGEHSGRIDQEITRSAEFFQRKSLQKLDLAAEWLPRLLYVAVVLFTMWQIVNMALGIGDSYNSVLMPE